jgi:hypothetical protein
MQGALTHLSHTQLHKGPQEIIIVMHVLVYRKTGFSSPYTLMIKQEMISSIQTLSRDKSNPPDGNVCPSFGLACQVISTFTFLKL